MAKYGCPEKFITMVRLFHDGMQALVKNNGMSSEPFPVSSGGKKIVSWRRHYSVSCFELYCLVLL